VKTAAVFIVGQSLALGLLLVFLVVPGNAVFLDVYGAGRLPYVYLLVAGLGALVSYGLTILQSRLGLYPLALSTTLAVAGSSLVFWALLAFAGLDWIAYGVLVLFNLELQLGFVFIGAQAGRAFDVQELKRIFSYVVAGFVVGFMLGGFAASGFAALGGNPLHLLAASAATTLAMTALMLGAARHVHEPLPEAGHPADGDAQAKPSLARILGIPLVASVFAYQVLSSMGTQLVEYMVYDRAAVRYSGKQALAGFVGDYSAVLNLADLVVLVAVGGVLMTRYGLRYGLGANPVIVSLLVAVAAIVAIVFGPGATSFFFLLAVARITDLAMADAATRTSVNATFKALPPRQWLAAQVAVEGAGVPIALGLTAALILAINAVPGATVTHVAVATLLICTLWSVAAILVYRRYQAAVIVAARRRLLDGQVVDLSEPATRNALRALCVSDDPRDVSVGISLIARADDGDAERLMRSAAESKSIEVQKAVVDHLRTRDPGLARRIALSCIETGAPEHVLDGLRVLGALPGAADLAAVAPFLEHDDLRLKAAATGAVLGKDADPGGLSARLEAAAASPEPGERRFAAMAIAEAGLTPSIALLAGLLGDADQTVCAEAAAAAASLDDGQRIALLAWPMEAGSKIRFLRACRYRASPDFCARVADVLSNKTLPTAELVRVLSAAGWQADHRHRGTVDRLITRETDRIATARRWIDAVSNSDPALAVATVRLRRALAQEAIASGRRLIDLLGLVYDRGLMIRVGRILQGTMAGDAGLALESLDVLLAPDHRVPVIRALKTAFDANLVESGGSVRPPFQLATNLTTLAGDCRWAIQMDWLLACVVALMRDRGIALSTIGAIAPLGPISAELILAHRG
jgi:hypothetical protein